MKTFSVATVFLAAALSGTPGLSQEAAKPSPDQLAIRETIESYTKAFNAGDAAGVAEHWTDQGEWVLPGGVRLVGRATIEKALISYFNQADEKRQVEVLDAAIRLVSPTVALEDGVARVSSAASGDLSSYTAVHVKSKDGWRIASMRESEGGANRGDFDALADLDWLIGAWVIDENGRTSETTCQRAPGGRFLKRSFAVTENGPSVSGIQVVGWNASSNSIRAWQFDSRGVFSEESWVFDGDHLIAVSSNQAGQPIAWRVEAVVGLAAESKGSSHEKLKSLEWMVGDWVTGDGESKLESRVRWMQDRNFLVRSFQVSIQGEAEMQGTQVIGWDPKQSRIRSWVFDSAGGTGEGDWNKSEDAWTIKTTHQFSSGEMGTATRSIKPIDDDSFTLEVHSRDIAGRIAPHLEPITVSRKK